jgi:hypothetical protein
MELVQPFVDERIETLAEVLDPVALAQHLRAVSSAPWNGRGVEEAGVVRVIRHNVGKRCTLEIGVRAGGDWHFLIGKVYRKDRTKVFQSMEAIRQAGFGPQEEFSIPQPVAYLPSLRLLLQEKVEGPVAGDVFKSGGERSQADAAERCARWLARFHALAPRTQAVSYPLDHLNSKSMQRYSEKITQRGGSLAEKTIWLHERIEQAASLLSPVEMCAGHGSYSASHVLLAEGRTIVFDWDGYDVADPARDVARFLSALRKEALGLGSIRALDVVADVFLKTYLAVGQPIVEQNLRFFEAATCLNLAKHSLCRPIPDWQVKQEKADAMLDESLRILEQEAV